jgi:hypothetical protein
MGRSVFLTFSLVHQEGGSIQMTHSWNTSEVLAALAAIASMLVFFVATSVCIGSNKDRLIDPHVRLIAGVMAIFSLWGGLWFERYALTGNLPEKKVPDEIATVTMRIVRRRRNKRTVYEPEWRITTNAGRVLITDVPRLCYSVGRKITVQLYVRQNGQLKGEYLFACGVP